MSRTDRSAQNVRRLREAFRQEYTTNPDLYYEEDYQKLETDDWYVKRFFLARNRNETEALRMIVETMKWRKEIKIREFRDYHFPIEFYKIGALFIYECDRNGFLTVYIRVKMHRKIPELDDHSRKFLIHVLNKADIMTGGNGIGVVFDVTGAGYRNLDWDYLKFLINSGSNYFPVGVKYILVVNVPWAFNAVRRAALSFLPASLFGLIKFANGDEIFNFIDKASAPDYLGGTCKRNYRAIPPGSRPVSQVVTEFGYSTEDIDRILPEFADALEEASKALETGDYINPSSDFWDSLEEESDIKDEIRESGTKDSAIKCIIVNPSKSLMFRYDYCDRAYEATLVISNPLESPVAFKIQSTNPSKYTVSPSLGIILPKRTITATIKFNQDSGSAIKKDKFLILGLPIERTWLTVEDFYALWVQHKDDIYSHKLLPFSEADHCYDETKNVDDYGDNNTIRRKLMHNGGTIINGDSRSNMDEHDQQISRLTERINMLVNQQKKTWIFLIIIILLYLLVLSYILLSDHSFDSVHLFQDYSAKMMESLR
ncbi:motile sperm domain-containing protein 2-like [Tetranychus urticae]|uniref:motile sperm domain-containing protein 2-like n=1 Tax=Tetranychus urticae TaxID=32264 RepID=UPI00077BCBAF|nr:motile sperm domain-containing protein 2-like [Tetranychus urticae]